MSNQKYAVAFMRSTAQEQIRGRELIADQHEAIVSYAKRYDFKIRKTFRNTERGNKALTETLKYCRDNPEIKYLIVRNTTRISRDIIQCFRLRGAFGTYGVEIRLADTSVSEPDAVHEKFLDDMRVSAQSYHDRISEMIRRRMQSRCSKGYSVQRPPLGYVKSVTNGLYETTNTASALRVYFRKTLIGEMSILELRKSISHIYHAGDTLISFGKLRKVVSNPYYAGFVSCQGQLYKGLHEPILTPEEQQQLIKLLKR